MKKRNRYLDELGIPRGVYAGNFVTEKKRYRLYQRYGYGFDYRDIFNMDVFFAEWLYSHMFMYREKSVHYDTMNVINFEGSEHTIEDAVDWIIEKTGEYLKYEYYVDAHFDYTTLHPFIGKVICRMKPSVRNYLEKYEWSEEKECQIRNDYIKAVRLFLQIMGYCWL